jgi:uncharacterized protein (DUF1778 family)
VPPALLAASYGLSWCNMVVATQETAVPTIEQKHIIRLSIEDQSAFADAILDPPEPTPALCRSFRRHHDLIKETRSPVLRAGAP